jgi:hypothetical protein
MVGQPPLSLSKDNRPYPDDHTRIVSEYFAVLGPPIAPGAQLSEPRTASDSMFGPHNWYSCLRQPASPPQPGTLATSPAPAWVETVIVYGNGRVHGQLPGPAPHFCDGQTYNPI